GRTVAQRNDMMVSDRAATTEVRPMTIQLSPDIENRLKTEAQRRGLNLSECASQLLDQALPKPDHATLDLLAKWDEEDATDDPEEIARRQREAEEFLQNLARNRLEMEGPNARKIWP